MSSSRIQRCDSVEQCSAIPSRQLHPPNTPLGSQRDTLPAHCLGRKAAIHQSIGRKTCDQPSVRRRRPLGLHLRPNNTRCAPVATSDSNSPAVERLSSLLPIVRLQSPFYRRRVNSVFVSAPSSAQQRDLARRSVHEAFDICVGRDEFRGCL